jgi:hypothetical protein
MDIIYCLIVILILAITALVLNEEIKINPLLNNIVTKTLILLGVVYAGLVKDYPMAVLLSILFVVLTNDHVNNSLEKFQEGSQAQETTQVEMKLDLTPSNDEQKCLAKCVSIDEEPENCMEYCENNCFLSCTNNSKNMNWGECKLQCQ